MTVGSYILRGVDVVGTVAFYTGKAGQEFVSPSEQDSFGYQSLQGAQRKATVLNHMSLLHGWRFIVVGYVLAHGIVPASALPEFTNEVQA